MARSFLGKYAKKADKVRAIQTAEGITQLTELPVRSPQSGDNGEADHKEISCSDVRTQGVQNTQTHTRMRARKHTLEQQKTEKCAFNNLKRLIPWHKKVLP